MDISQAVKMIKKREGFVDSIYFDGQTGSNPYKGYASIGYGHLITPAELRRVLSQVINSMYGSLGSYYLLQKWDNVNIKNHLQANKFLEGTYAKATDARERERSRLKGLKPLLKGKTPLIWGNAYSDYESYKLQLGNLLNKDIYDIALVPLSNLVTVPVNDNQLCALISLVYNIGSGSFAKSRLLKKLNKQNYDGAGGEFLDGWDTSNGVVLEGLKKRRREEYKLFTNPYNSWGFELKKYIIKEYT